MKLCLVCSSGGHLFELYALKPFWSKFERFWVTFDKEDARHLLRDERVYQAYHPTNRNINNLLRNCYLAFRIITKEKPDIVISTGAGVAVPFLYVGRLVGAKVVFIESMTRVGNLSLSGRLVCPIVHHLFVQWPELAKKIKKAEFHGQVV